MPRPSRSGRQGTGGTALRAELRALSEAGCVAAAMTSTGSSHSCTSNVFTVHLQDVDVMGQAIQ